LRPLTSPTSALSTADKPAAAAAPRPAAPAKPAAPAAAAPSPAKPAARPGGFTPFGVQAAASRPAYERSGDGLREAIKARDLEGCRGLLAAGVTPGYVDAQGMSLLHIACLFDAGDIALALLEAGGELHKPNGQGESALDCAPAALAMRLKARAAQLAAAAAA